MKIHKVGYKIIAESTIIFASIVVISWFAIPENKMLLSILFTAIAVVLEILVISFFRYPKRNPVIDDNINSVYAPADGEVVAVEPVYEDEFFKDEMIQISIFMSLTNVHANFYPISGEIEYFKYHPGSFLVAWHPKSSTENERTSVVVNSNGNKIMFRQIAGFIARRIVSKSKEGMEVERGKYCGFIKFGSRLDVFVPLGSHICVGLGDKTVGSQTKIAQLPQVCK